MLEHYCCDLILDKRSYEMDPVDFYDLFTPAHYGPIFYRPSWTAPSEI